MARALYCTNGCTLKCSYAMAAFSYAPFYHINALLYPTSPPRCRIGQNRVYTLSINALHTVYTVLHGVYVYAVRCVHRIICRVYSLCVIKRLPLKLKPRMSHVPCILSQQYLASSGCMQRSNSPPPPTSKPTPWLDEPRLSPLLPKFAGPIKHARW